MNPEQGRKGVRPIRWLVDILSIPGNPGERTKYNGVLKANAVWREMLFAYPALSVI